MLYKNKKGCKITKIWIKIKIAFLFISAYNGI